MENNFRNTPINQFETVTVVNQNVLLRNSFAWMSLALVLTSLTSLAFGFVPFLAEFLTQNKLTFYVAMFATLIFVFIIGARFEKMSFPALAGTFVAYSLVNGISLSFVFSDKIPSKYPLFAEHYPTLLELSLKDNFDMTRLEYMLRLKDNIDNETISQHDASVHVGQHLYDKYVKDKISHKPPPPP
jgi:hypothetical protein